MCLSSSSCLPCACCRCQWVWWCCPGCHAESGCSSLSAPLAALPTLARFLLTDEQASSGCSDRPGNLSLKGKAESRKVIPGLAAEVSGHVTESTELVVVPFQIPFYRFTGDAGPDSLTFDLKTEKDKTVHWVVTFMTQGMEDCNKIHINLCIQTFPCISDPNSTLLAGSTGMKRKSLPKLEFRGRVPHPLW